MRYVGCATGIWISLLYLALIFHMCEGFWDSLCCLGFRLHCNSKQNACVRLQKVLPGLLPFRHRLYGSSDVKHHKALKLFVCEKNFSWKKFSFTQAASNLTKVIWQFSQSLKLCRSFFSLAQIKKCFQMTRTIREVFIRIWQVAHIEVYQVYDHTIESYIRQIICCIYAI